MSAMQTESSSPYTAAAQHPGRRKDGLIARLRTDRGLLRRVLMIGGVALVAAVSLAMWLIGGRYVSTDDAYVQSAKLMVTTDVSGLIKEVDVKEGQYVKKGQILFRLDPEPFEIALADANASLREAALTIDSMKQDYQGMLANSRAQQAQVDLAQRNFDRYAKLVKANAIAESTYDTARSTLQSARAQLSALRHDADTQLAKLGGNPDIPTDQHPQYLQALAHVHEMQRQLDHSIVRAPFDGVVSEVDSLQPGTLLISALSAFATTSAVGLVATHDTWIEAHMKETDLTHVHVGAPVTFTIDTYPGRTWHGHVEAISAGTGSAFAVLPSENASGNWVKVVQRIPVKIAVDKKAGDPELRVGMSTVVDIDTGERRWYRMLHG